MPRENNDLRRLSEAELDVMRVIWEMISPVTVQRVLEHFSKERDWKTSTLSTIMERLIDKGFLRVIKTGKPNIYEAALNEADYKERETRAFLKSMHGGSVRSFIAALGDGSGIGGAELAAIRDWFNTHKDGGGA
ncbi:MAG: BlaI/MecI/CopY family transcriptional regulator [Clostridiales bacterium]|jgi:BlaI family penicillinase repressor|nr:BlaI/MecI/CopY family transcriptional regulator [Clostridiales bacterium]